MKKALMFFLFLTVLSICGCSSVPNPVISHETESPMISENTLKPAKSEQHTPEPTTHGIPEPSQLSIEEVCQAGKINANTYTNDVLGFKATIPEDWQFASGQEIDDMFAQTASQNSAIAQAANQNAYLFFCSKSGLNSDKNENSVMSVFISYTNGLALTMPQANFDRYLKNDLTAFQEALPDTDINLSGEQESMLGEKSYTVIYRECTDDCFIYNQDTYICELGEFMIVFSPNYVQDDKEAIQEIMSNLKYTR